QEALVLRAGRRNLRRTAQQLVLLCQDFARDLPATKARAELEKRYREFARLPGWLWKKNPALTWLDKVINVEEAKNALLSIAPLILGSSFVLNEIAREIAYKLRSHFLVQEPNYPKAIRAFSLCASYEAELGEFERAVWRAEEAVFLARDLVKIGGPRFLRLLAQCLSDLADCYREAGEHKKSLRAAGEARRHYKKILRSRDIPREDDQLVSQCAQILNSIAFALSELGRYALALKVARVVERLFADLERRHGGQYLWDHAMSLNNLANRLREVGSTEEALSVSLQAVDQYRKLDHEKPDRWRINFVVSLGLLGLIQLDCGKHHEAAKTLEEAIRKGYNHFATIPLRFANLFAWLVDGYRRSCERGHVEPDEQLVAPIEAKLAELEARAAGEESGDGPRDAGRGGGADP
ncbi:MAG: tetratricopeptide repeat protein, partial [Geminicoccaceae bacterium]|nr:tetratricopeptide repeat protein [Geminicoccaceae bacterium]